MPMDWKHKPHREWKMEIIGCFSVNIMLVFMSLNSVPTARIKDELQVIVKNMAKIPSVKSKTHDMTLMMLCSHTPLSFNLFANNDTIIYYYTQAYFQMTDGKIKYKYTGL